MKKIIRTIGMVILFLLFLALSGAGILTVKGYLDYKKAVNFASLDVKMNEIRQKDSFTPYEEIPDLYKAAVLSVEDKRFFKHNGFDILATGRALYHDLRAGSLVEGGSTITQQLAKNMYYTQEKKFTRKISEIFTALALEKRFSKEEIFEAYVNNIYFGEGYYSVAEASYGYFGKAPLDMTASECTLLAGVPNAPSAYAPTVNLKLSKLRQKQVLKQMVNCDYLTPAEADYILTGETLLADTKGEAFQSLSFFHTQESTAAKVAEGMWSMGKRAGKYVGDTFLFKNERQNLHNIYNFVQIIGEIL